MTRKEAIKILEFEKQGVFKSLATKEALDMAISALSENKGEWIPVYGKNGKTIMSYKCSKCNFHPKHAIITDFCGGCGADMRGVSK